MGQKAFAVCGGLEPLRCSAHNQKTHKLLYTDKVKALACLDDYCPHEDATQH